MARPKTAPVSHKDICKAVAKIGAYLRCSNEEKAKEWADTLVGYMVEMKVYPTHIKTGYGE